MDVGGIILAAGRVTALLGRKVVQLCVRSSGAASRFAVARTLGPVRSFVHGPSVRFTDSAGRSHALHGSFVM